MHGDPHLFGCGSIEPAMMNRTVRETLATLVQRLANKLQTRTLVAVGASEACCGEASIQISCGLATPRIIPAQNDRTIFDVHLTAHVSHDWRP